MKLRDIFDVNDLQEVLHLLANAPAEGEEKEVDVTSLAIGELYSMMQWRFLFIMEDRIRKNRDKWSDRACVHFPAPRLASDLYVLNRRFLQKASYTIVRRLMEAEGQDAQEIYRKLGPILEEELYDSFEQWRKGKTRPWKSAT